MDGLREYIVNAVFHAQQKPEILADFLIENIVLDQPLVIVIDHVAVDGPLSIEKPKTGNVSVKYKGTPQNKYNGEVEGSVEFSLKEAVSGVTVTTDGTVTVESTCTAKSFILKAYSSPGISFVKVKIV